MTVIPKTFVLEEGMFWAHPPLFFVFGWTCSEIAHVISLISLFSKIPRNLGKVIFFKY